ncbi:hypothetical protein NQX30_05485 [Candidatus Persebacteraceae bacterium Df01]|jgi:gp16 family phage-associated protein|uniref:HTH cro/C1-type domain-containing protein n=1 Tax=Candidatus Doriopsillibacter californiensis TaxID=2970740 RepID=A0ABT7QM77_9GAMM|nr:hypothetical protein [Candidatus Persebacteraceae bacterium Df01]
MTQQRLTDKITETNNILQLHIIAHIKIMAEAAGICWADWARTRKLSPATVRQVLTGRSSGRRGHAREVVGELKNLSRELRLDSGAITRESQLAAHRRAAMARRGSV